MRRVPDGEAHSLFERFVPLDLHVQCEASLAKHGLCLLTSEALRSTVCPPVRVHTQHPV